MKRSHLPLVAISLFSAAGVTVRAQSSAEPSPVDAVRQRMQASISRQLNSITVMNKAAARTREAAEHHQKPVASGFFDLPVLPVLQAVSMPGCDPLPATKIDTLVNSAAAATTVDPDLIRQVMKQESADNPCAVSKKGAMGLMQLMPSTAAEFGVEDAFAPEDNVLGGARLLRQLINHYSGNLSLVLSAYNAGQGVVDANMTVPDFHETTDYVHEILSRLLPEPDTPPVLSSDPSIGANDSADEPGIQDPVEKEHPTAIH